MCIRPGISLAAALSLIVLAVGVPARAADVQVEAPSGCADGESLTRAVEQLVGAPLPSLPALSFRAHIASTEGGHYRLQLDSFAPGLARGRRIIEGATCKDAADAAAVAIALALSAAVQRPPMLEPELEPEPEPEPAPELDPVPEEKPAAEALRVSPQPEASDSAAPAAAARTHLVPQLAFGAVLDVGSLPETAVGAALDLGVGYGAWVARAYGLLTAGQLHTPAQGTGGGLFSLSAAGLLACWNAANAPPFMQVCAGGELVALHAAGRGLDVRHRHTDVAASLRAELGLGLPIAGAFSLWLRPGIAVPLSRPRFVLPDGRVLHQVETIAVRGTLGVQWVM